MLLEERDYQDNTIAFVDYARIKRTMVAATFNKETSEKNKEYKWTEYDNVCIGNMGVDLVTTL